MSVSGVQNHHLIVMLYDQAIRFLRHAIDDIQQGGYAGQARNIRKTEGIIDELNSLIDMDAGGDVAENLRGIYNLMIQQLEQANNSSDVHLIYEVISQLEELNESWRVVTG